ncbi:quinone-dependent dihydroorotate dehydrogenase [Aureimonas jatrophae]|uniref:Dihydroorotate dehydrogenase (quinone) n=1 Tax=Aureimonas jatrophae TaxID=1166073 RepID=A0A1H0KK32_9HYPH|nr:quinone-dependent dihydroorotate dehydrogenase [Aureimonas jatrophae]MBB3948740.1 dihydroorotate dehydrogenase [Aureimonas jatrophae]SDO56193.1 dihydroorotate oxidase A [Aureimonas jatrophae]
MSRLYRFARPVLFALDPERAHGLSLEALKRGLFKRQDLPLDARLRVEVAGLRFPNPLGLAAGYDKNAEAPDALLRLGFGFVEIGTVTPQPQEGNERPRIFRLPESFAVINRLGFNNEGHADVAERLEARRRRGGIVGVNIGANKDTSDRIGDYVAGIHRFLPLSSYLTVNISSPNTPGLRDLQKGSSLDELLEHSVAARDGAAAILAEERRPLFVKVAPDLSRDEIEAIAETALRRKVDGLIVSNTTLSRQGVEGRRFANETGGLSGRPLFSRSTYALAAFRRALGSDFPLIGAGGVESARTALGKMEAGADLVQLYTSLIYGGPELPIRILNGMIRYLDKTGSDTIRQIRDTKVDEILARDPPLGWEVQRA